MELVPIFDHPKPTLYAIQYEGKTDEFHRAFEHWQDPEYLRRFFKQHQEDLEHGYYQTSINNAVRITRAEAQALEETILDCCEQGQYDSAASLQTFFQSLRDDDYRLYHLQKTKGKERWLRLYAVRIAAHLYVITGGTIKLTRRMQDREHTQIELQKLDEAVEFLKALDLIDPDDFEKLEL